MIKLSKLDWAAIREAAELGGSVSEMWNYYKETKLGPEKSVGEALPEFIDVKV
jgi:hypothetical protein